MSSRQRLSLSDQARELQEEIAIPKTLLQSRPLEPGSAAKLPVVEVGREGHPSVPVETAVRSKVVPEESQERVQVQPAVEAPPPTPKSARQPANHIARTPEEMVRDQKDLVALGTQIPRRVRDELNRFVFSRKAEGKVISMQDIVSMALVHFLRIEDI